MEHSQALVGPQTDEAILILHEVGITHEDALEYLTQVSQVESVVGLRGSR